jgi:hypothetical protein
MQMYKALLIFFCASIVACSSKPIPFTDYIVSNLLRDNLMSLAEPAIFSIEEIIIIESEHSENSGRATVDVRLKFPEDFDTVTSLHKLEPFNMAYKQYQSSFGKFAAGEQQVHHAEYQFQRRDGKWFIVGSKALSPPDIIAVTAQTPAN